MTMYNHTHAMRIAGLTGATAVALGALGAHALKAKMLAGIITPVQLSGYETGCLYHLVHAVVLLGIAALRQRQDTKFLRYSFYLVLWGILLFSGSLYLLGIRDLVGAPWLRLAGPVTPVGGLLLMAGWICLCLPSTNKG